jgi:hypothetical protein
MNKPQWKDAPTWAKYVAMDADGEWCWFETKPIQRTGYWYSDFKMDMVLFDNGWKDSLEERPNE